MTSLLDAFFPTRSITVTSSDPSFFTPEIKAALRKKNSLMRQGRTEEANALALRIREMLLKVTSKSLAHVQTNGTSYDLWSAVNEFKNKKKTTPVPQGVNADSLNRHYATISTDRQYTEPFIQLSAN